MRNRNSPFVSPRRIPSSVPHSEFRNPHSIWSVGESNPRFRLERPASWPLDERTPFPGRRLARRVASLNISVTTQGRGLLWATPGLASTPCNACGLPRRFAIIATFARRTGFGPADAQRPMLETRGVGDKQGVIVVRGSRAADRSLGSSVRFALHWIGRGSGLPVRGPFHFFRRPTVTDSDFMARALALAERGRGAVEPNPLVGAAVVRDGAIVGEGWHQRYGQAARRGQRPGRGRRGGPRRRRCTSRWSRAATTARRRPAPTPSCAPASGGSSRRWPTRSRRSPAAGRPSLRAGGRRGRGRRRARREAARLNAPYLKLLRTGRPWVHRQVGDDARRQDRHPHRRLEVDQRRGVPAAASTSCAAGWTPSSSAAARWSPTTRC